MNAYGANNTRSRLLQPEGGSQAAQRIHTILSGPQRWTDSMNTSLDHTYTFGFRNSSEKHLGLQIAPPLRPLPSVHDLRLPQTPAFQRRWTKDRVVSCLHKKPITQLLGVMEQEPCPQSCSTPSPGQRKDWVFRGSAQVPGLQGNGETWGRSL